MKIEDFDYHLPEELIAQKPAERSIGIFMTYWSIYSREIVWC